jgi:hypothetical protein
MKQGKFIMTAILNMVSALDYGQTNNHHESPVVEVKVYHANNLEAVVYSMGLEQNLLEQV